MATRATNDPATTFYLDQAAGSDAAVGTPYPGSNPLAPVSSFGFLRNTVGINDGDTIYYRGDYRGQISLADRARTGLQILWWGGASAAGWVRGDVVTDPEGWTDDPSGTIVAGGRTWYQFTDMEPAAVVVNWDGSVTVNGDHPAHLKPAASIAACKLALNSFFFNGDGNLYITIGITDDIAGGNVEVAYSPTEQNGIDIDAPNGIIEANPALWCEGRGGATGGWGILSSGNGLEWRFTKTADTGYKAAGLRGRNIKITPVATSSSPVVMSGMQNHTSYTTVNGVALITVQGGQDDIAAGQMTRIGIDGTRIQMRGHSYLSRTDGLPFTVTGNPMTFILNHPEGGAEVITNTEIRSVDYLTPYGQEISCGLTATAAPVASPLNFHSYPIRHYDCTGDIAGAYNIGTCWLSGCVFISAKNIGMYSPTAGTGEQFAASGCVFVCDKSITFAGANIQIKAASLHVYLVACTLIDLGTITSDTYCVAFVNGAGTGGSTAYIRDCFMYCPTGVGRDVNRNYGYGGIEAGFELTMIDAQNCLAMGIGQFVEGVTVALPGVSGMNIMLADSDPFVNGAADNWRLNPAHAVAALVAPTPPFDFIDPDGRTFNGQYGGYQPPPDAPPTSRERLSRVRCPR